MNILQYESKIWATADLLRGSGIKESEWPSYMMPFFALAMIESLFRPDSKIEHGNTLVEDKFYNEEFDVIVANPPYGVSWKRGLCYEW